ncbi:MAG TPA: hypothetical protein VJ742_01020 [Nitrososphaera sp.]|nr:hypothetical protein [Nitrososphaera sp.]
MSLNLPTKPLEPFNVLAFDPGGTTGWARALLPGEIEDNVELESILLETGEFTGQHHEELYNFIVDMADGEKSLEVVSEPFHFRQHKDNPRQGLELVSCEYIGVMRLACAQLGLRYYDRFTPGEAKRYVTDKKLELLGWLQTPVTPMRHRNDALRQLVKYLIVKKSVRHPITTSWKREA